MSSRRLLKAGEAIREVVSMAILTELRDPRVKNVTVIGVEVAPDMREAKILVSIMGSESQQATSLRGLKNSAGFLQSKIAERIDTRYTPKLTFVADEGVKKSLALAQILDQLALEKQKNQQATDSVAVSEPVDDELDELDEAEDASNEAAIDENDENDELSDDREDDGEDDGEFYNRNSPDMPNA
ncbi:MAG: 30S ribosome-binding factor RbfA [Planctomycetota bacterium]|nr:30S ribosome-binding factor RbfA [Planctomycetota bacterium]